MVEAWVPDLATGPENLPGAVVLAGPHGAAGRYDPREPVERMGPPAHHRNEHHPCVGVPPLLRPARAFPQGAAIGLRGRIAVMSCLWVEQGAR